MSSKTAPRSTATFASSSTTVPARPTTEITLAGRTYTARAPKYQVWWDVARMLDATNLGSDAMRRLTEEADSLTEEEIASLAAEVEVMATMGGLEEAIVYGRPDPDDPKRFTGGFLRRALRRDDWTTILAEVDDDDSDLDLPELVHAAVELRRTFQPWFDARSETMGLPVPKVDEVGPKAGAKRSGTTRARR